MKYILACLAFLAIIYSCGQNQPSEGDKNESEIEELFPEFPTKPFKNIEFGSLNTVVIEGLNSAGYVEDKDQPLHYVNESLKIEIILPESETLSSFKVFFFNKKEDFLADLSALFLKNSQKSSISEVFSSFEFITDEHKYSATIFEMENSVRLDFNLKATH